MFLYPKSVWTEDYREQKLERKYAFTSFDEEKMNNSTVF